jgi:hypothetical protein
MTVVCKSLEEDVSLSEDEQALKLSLFLAAQHDQELIRHQHEQELIRHSQKRGKPLVLHRNNRYVEAQRGALTVEKDLDNLREQITALMILHQRRRHCFFDEQESSRVENKLGKLKALVQETFVHADKVTRGLRAAPDDSPEIKQLYENTRGALKRKITECRRQYRDFEQQMRQRSSESNHSLPATQTTDDFIAGKQLTAAEQLQHIDELLMDSELAAHAEQDQEDLDVMQVIRDVSEMNQLFADFGELAYAQRAPTDRVTAAVMETKARADEGLQAIKRAAELNPKCVVM